MPPLSWPYVLYYTHKIKIVNKNIWKTFVIVLKKAESVLFRLKNIFVFMQCTFFPFRIQLRVSRLLPHPKRSSDAGGNRAVHRSVSQHLRQGAFQNNGEKFYRFLRIVPLFIGKFINQKPGHCLRAEVSEKIDSMTSSVTGSGAETVSFVSDKNTNIASVQFVIKTAAIEGEDTVISDVVEEETLTFRQKLLQLFGL